MCSRVRGILSTHMRSAKVWHLWQTMLQCYCSHVLSHSHKICLLFLFSLTYHPSHAKRKWETVRKNNTSSLNVHAVYLWKRLKKLPEKPLHVATLTHLGLTFAPFLQTTPLLIFSNCWLLFAALWRKRETRHWVCMWWVKGEQWIMSCILHVTSELRMTGRMQLWVGPMY